MIQLLSAIICAGEYMLPDKSEGKTVSHTIFQASADEGTVINCSEN